MVTEKIKNEVEDKVCMDISLFENKRQHCYKRNFGTQNFSIINIPPKGYMTSNEFWSLVNQDIDDICREYGILQ